MSTNAISTEVETVFWLVAVGLMISRLSSRGPVCQWVKGPVGQSSLQCSIIVSVQTEASPPKKNLRQRETKFSGLMKPHLNFLALILSIIFGGNKDQINKTKNQRNGVME